IRDFHVTGVQTCALPIFCFSFKKTSMNLEDIFLPAEKISAEPWQLGSIISSEIKENSIVLIFCSDYRGISDGEAEMADFRNIRKIGRASCRERVKKSRCI